MIFGFGKKKKEKEQEVEQAENPVETTASGDDSVELVRDEFDETQRAVEREEKKRGFMRFFRREKKPAEDQPLSDDRSSSEGQEQDQRAEQENAAIESITQASSKIREGQPAAPAAAAQSEESKLRGTAPALPKTTETAETAEIAETTEPKEDVSDPVETPRPAAIIAPVPEPKPESKQEDDEEVTSDAASESRATAELAPNPEPKPEAKAGLEPAPETAAPHFDKTPDSKTSAEITEPPKTEIENAEEKTGKASLVSRWSQGLRKSTSNFTDLFTKRKLDEETLEEIEDTLIAADLGAEVAGKVTELLARDRFDKQVEAQEIREALAQIVVQSLSPREKALDIAASPDPQILLLVGVNGSGKTTTAGKLAVRLMAAGKSVLLVAGDTFRAAAVEQLKVWGERVGTDVLAGDAGADAAGLVFDAMSYAKKEKIDVVIVDTAGRLQNRKELMDELAKMVRVTKKFDPSAPHHVLLVLDATVGQNALLQAKIFTEVAGVSGLVMTKLDGTAKGGVLVALAEKFELPIHYVGIGEQVDDLRPFDAHDFARALAGMENEARP